MKKKEIIFGNEFTEEFFHKGNFHICIHEKSHTKLLEALNSAMPEENGKFADARLYFNDFKGEAYKVSIRKHAKGLYLYFLDKSQEFLNANAEANDTFSLYATDQQDTLLMVLNDSCKPSLLYGGKKITEINNDRPFIVIDLFSGSYTKKYTGHEKYNLEANSVDGRYYGYCPPLDNIDIKNLGANKDDTCIDGVTVVYVQKAANTNNREIIAFCDDATIYSPCVVNPSLCRLGTDDKGNPIDISYSIESDNMISLTGVRDKFVIEIKKYNNLMFRRQRFFKGTYPDLDELILKYIESCRKRQDFLEDESYQNDIQESFGDSGSKKSLNIGNGSASEMVKKDPAIAKAAISKANHKCEFEKAHSTFMTAKGLPYMEGHHLIPCTPYNARRFFEIYGVNIDCVENIVSLCPTCHRRIHFGSAEEKRDVIKRLYELRKSELERIGITITLQELYNLYE